MNDERYNGWANYETWAVNLWLSNDEGSHNYWAEQATEALECSGREWSRDDAVYILKDILAGEHEDAIDAMEIPTCFVTDLIGAAMSEVNWYEIAEHLIDTAIEAAQYADS